MSVLTFRVLRRRALCGSAIVAALGFAADAAAQTQLPEVVVTAPKEKEKPKAKPVQVRAAPRPVLAPAPAPAAAPVTPAAQLNAKADTFDQARSNLYTTIGTTADVISHATIDALPGGDNTPVENPVAGPWGVAGFRRERPPSCAQRPRQRAVSHQWSDAARRPDRLRQHS